MSYDCTLKDPVTGETLQVDTPHHIRGGTYLLGGTHELTLNVTYNYHPQFCKALGKELTDFLQGRLASETIPEIRAAIAKLGDDVSEDYWAPTEGNAKRALYGLLALAEMRPDGVWSVS